MWNQGYNNPNQPSMMMGAGNLYGQTSPKTGFTSPTNNMMGNPNQFGFQQPNTGVNKLPFPGQEKEKQLQQIKSQFSNFQQKQIMSNNNQPIDLVELTMQINTKDVALQIPLALVLDARFPSVPPKIFVKSRLKHNLFEVKDQVIELDPNNVIAWTPQQTTLNDLFTRLNAIFQTDPPKQEKIIEDVNRLLTGVTEQSFKDLVGADGFSSRNVNELQQLRDVSSFQELICSTPEYKKVAQNLMDVVEFNDRTAKELLQKKDAIDSHQQSLLLVSDTIENLNREYNDRVEKCRGFKDAFSRQNIEGFVQKEIKNLDSQSLNIESIAHQHGNIFEVLQSYLDTRKAYHRLNIIRTKLPEMKF